MEADVRSTDGISLPPTRRDFLAVSLTVPAMRLPAALLAQTEPPTDRKKRPDRPTKPTLPENHPPFPQSTVIKGARWLELKPKPPDGKKPQRYRKLDGSPADKLPGDVWTCTWADDDQVYAVADDSSLGKYGIYRIEGTPPAHTVIEHRDMKEYQSKLKAPVENQRTSWKGAGLTCVDGVLYLAVYVQWEPEAPESGRAREVKGEPRKLWVPWNAQDLSLLKSTDHGKTWSHVHGSANALFPGRQFPTPFFVQFGKDYGDAMDDYVYAVSNNGGWNNWDYMLLARVPRNKLPALRAADWEVFASADTDKSSWSPDFGKAAPVFQYTGNTSMTGMQWVPAARRFLMAQWGYDASDFRRLYWVHLYEAPKPWGPWRHVHTERELFGYCVNFPAKWFADGGKKLWGVWSGREDWYRFNARGLELQLA